MELIIGLATAVVLVWGLCVAYLKTRRGLDLDHALLYAPLKLALRIRDRAVNELRLAEPPVVYVIDRKSNLDSALMLALLPHDTLHILDESAARSHWLDPFRTMARTIGFNAEHVFMSRRLVRHLRARGRLAVYLGDIVEPDAKSFRLYRAVARIAARAEARIIAVSIARRPGLLPRLELVALPAQSLATLMARTGGAEARPSNALFDRLAEARLTADNIERTIFSAVRDAALTHGPSRQIVDDTLGASLSYRELLRGAAALARRIDAASPRGEAVGLLVPGTCGMVVAFMALQSAARPTAMINYTAGTANVASAIRTAEIRLVLGSRAFVEKAHIEEVVAAIEDAGARILWLEDVARDITAAEKLVAAISWRRPLVGANPANPAVILFTSGSEDAPKGVVLSHRNLVANALQVANRISFGPADALLNVLPTFHSFGLTAGTLLPLIAGVRLHLYPSPLHYRIIPEVAARLKPTIMVGTDTFLVNYARAAGDGDFASLRLVVAGAEPVRNETRAIWRERFGAEIVEGFGMTEASPVVAVNTATHGRAGTVGRLLPGMRARLESVEGIAEGERLFISGPNLMLGYMVPERPGEIALLEGGWHDTGDIVAMDREGFLAIKGRARRFAKIAGEMVSLGAVEMLARTLWPEERHAVVAVPDRRRGEKLVLVTTEPSAERGALMRFGRKAGASGVMLPDAIVKVDDLPLLGSGKTDYERARQMALATLGLDEAA